MTAQAHNTMTSISLSWIFNFQAEAHVILWMLCFFTVFSCISFSCQLASSVSPLVWWILLIAVKSHLGSFFHADILLMRWKRWYKIKQMRIMNATPTEVYASLPCLPLISLTWYIAAANMHRLRMRQPSRISL